MSPLTTTALVTDITEPPFPDQIKCKYTITTNRTPVAMTSSSLEVKAYDSIVFPKKSQKELADMFAKYWQTVTIQKAPEVKKVTNYADLFSAYGTEFLSVITPAILSRIPEAKLADAFTAATPITSVRQYKMMKDGNSFKHLSKDELPFPLDFTEPVVRGIHQANIDGQPQFCPFVALRLIWKCTLKNKVVVEKEFRECVYVCVRKVQINNREQMLPQIIFKQFHSEKPFLRTLNGLNLLLNNQEISTGYSGRYNGTVRLRSLTT